MVEINFAKIEKKWQEKWEREKVFRTQGVPSASGKVNEKSKKEKYYVLEMFPYPSGTGLHMGHAWNYTIGDILARFKIMKGFNVLHPMGYDSLGLPAENAAIQAGKHPNDYTNESIPNFIRQQKAIGLSYDWSRILSSHDSSYYKWDQWIFLKMLEKGLAYQKISAVNWCSKCNSVLANEQVHDGKCWRHEDTAVEIRQLKQWFLKTTEYADELYENLDKMDWPDRTKAMQRNWIGKSHGTEIDFVVETKNQSRGFGVRGFGVSDELVGGKSVWPIFTTRPDTIFGVTFMVVAAQHPRLDELVTKEQKEDVDKFLKKLKSVSGKDIGDLEKEGVFSGSYAINPANGERVPIWVANFVIADYGSGMVMAVPAHDQRDFEFAHKYKINLVETIIPVDGKSSDPNKSDRAFTGYGILTRSGKFDGLEGKDAIVKITDWLIKKKLGRRITNFKLRDWGISRQRYWGTPIPIIHCEKCAINKTNTKITFDFHEKFRFNSIIEGKKTIETRVLDKKGRGDLQVGDLILLKHEDGGKKVAKIIGANYFKNLKEMYNNGKDLINDIFPYEKVNSFEDLENLYKKVSKGYVERINESGIGAWKIKVLNLSKVVPVPEKDLPIELPKNVKFGKGNPLETNEEWLNVKCPKCGGKGRRESDTMDTFVNSSWYFMRYCDSKNDKKIFEKKKVKYWCPVDTYIGGAEHACMHLIYSRFYVKFLRDLGLIDFDEPAIRLFHQGMLAGEGGIKMSKSKPETCVLPEDISNKYGIDTARFFLSSLASPDKNIDWSEKGIVGSSRFVNKMFVFFEEFKSGKDSDELLSLLNKTIKNISEYYENFGYRKATIEIRELFDLIEKGCSKDSLGKFLQLLSPICPHISEELWKKLGNNGFISISKWPKVDEKKIVKKGVIVGDLNSKIADRIKEIIKSETKIIYVYVMPFELGKVDSTKISKKIGKDVKVFAVNDSDKYDPENKAKKAKPGKIAIYLE